MSSIRRAGIGALVVWVSTLATAAELTAEVAKVPPTKTVRAAKKRRAATRLRKPSSVALQAAAIETVVHSEQTSFETLLAKREQAKRDPASLKPKARVISVRRELGMTRAMSDKAPLDIVLNAGTNAGLSEGMILGIMRRVPVLDPYRDNQQKEIEVEYGQVRVVHVQKELAVARVEKLEPIDKGLAMGTRAVFVGDYVGHSE